MPHQGLSPGRSHTRNFIQYRLYLTLGTQGAVIFDGKPVGFVLNTGNQLKALGVGVDGQFHIVVIKASGAVVVVFNHAADRNMDVQLLKHREGYVDLTPAAVHHQYIREPGKASQ